MDDKKVQKLSILLVGFLAIGILAILGIIFKLLTF